MESAQEEVILAERAPDVAMSVALLSEPDNVKATVTLDGFGSGYEATAEAPRSHQDPATHIEFELAVSRALGLLQCRIMQQIHEQIDRSTDDI
jgi:hypothetical protein